MTTRLDYASLESSSKWRNLPPPPGTGLALSGASSRTPVRSAATTAAAEASHAALREKRAWDLAISPAKQLPMQAFMLYMSGGGVQVFSMGIVFMLLFSPFKNVAAINAAFLPFTSPKTKIDGQAPASTGLELPLQKIVYLLCNLLTLALGLWKCRAMGLLPTGTGDWLAFETPIGIVPAMMSSQCDQSTVRQAGGHPLPTPTPTPITLF
ncbi:hypothetical protein M0805_003647 [Coniferiporia weirii]|nr:hypothetical protein M0805_003647 [Coniferiporia weirii]